MCVIIVKPAGVAMPSDDVINAAHTANPHGMGLVSATKFYKGLSLSQFKRVLSQVPESEPCIMHFRYATHGSVRASNCHPFKRGNTFFAHNGILDIEPIGDKTDSETAFIKYIYPAIQKYGYESKQVDAVIESVIGYSKFALMRRGVVRMYGNFQPYEDGCYYSNFNWLSRLNWATHKHRFAKVSFFAM